MKLLTLSIAAYNVEKYIEDILKKAVRCKNKDSLEILVIDDGGTDKTIEIAEEYEKKYPGVIIPIKKVNGGWGSTVNIGIRKATGRYFKLLDGDDYIDTDELDSFLDFLKNADSDMIYTSFRTFDDYTNKTLKEFEISGDLQNGEKYNIEDVANFIYPRMHAVTFKLRILKENNVKILENCFYTDVQYILDSMIYCNSVMIYKGITYNYRIARSGQSVSMEGLRKHYADHMKVTEELINQYYNLNINGNLKELFFNRVNDMIEAQYIIFWKIKEGKSNDYVNFESFLKNKEKFYLSASKQIVAARVFSKLGLISIFCIIFNFLKPNVTI